MPASDTTPRPARDMPAFRRDGAHALLVHLHAQTVARTGWQSDPTRRTDEVCAALADAAASLEGMARYQAHPFWRAAPEPAVIWRRGSVRVLDFGGSGPPVLTIPSMVNGPQIMDLAPALSPLRWLSGQGFRVLQVDWGVPGAEERGFGIGDYLERRLIPALDSVVRSAGMPAHLVGYCMGGPLMLALAQRAKDRVARIVTLGAPWDFSAFPEHAAMRANRAQVTGMLDTMGHMFGIVPPQMTQSFFALRDLASGAAKFRRFAAMDPMSDEALRFIAVEDWLNDGIPLPPKVARECFVDWLTDDAPRRGQWAPGGVAFSHDEVTQPALVVCAERDTVVRLSASEPLAEALVDSRLLKSRVGHIGMVVGAQAIEAIWKPVTQFLRG